MTRKRLWSIVYLSLNRLLNISGGQGSEDKTGQNRFVQRREVIRLISSMNATVGAKTAEQGLLKYKQVNTLLFMDQNKLC